MKIKPVCLTLLLLLAAPMGIVPAAAEEGERYHTVVKGDTLWDISETYFKNPFFWPKLWQWNQFISNPHFIYPGDKIRLGPPVTVLAVPAPEPGTEAVPAVEAPAAEAPPVEAAPIEAPAPPPPVVKGEMFNIRHLRSAGILTPEEIENAGKIIDARDEKVMLGDYDIFYVALKGTAAPGDRLSVFKPTDKIKHPTTGRVMGHKIERLGTLEVIDFAEKVATVKVLESFDVMSRGDLVRPYMKPVEEVEIREAASRLDGHIIASQEGQATFGEGDVVYIDLGSNKGVEAGNIFYIYKPSHKKEGYRIPPVTIGRLIAFEVKKATSTAVIVNSTEAMVPGELIRSGAAP